MKEEDKYTCPICDWRLKIPRDAARPRLEDLVEWYDEIPNLPFQPEEEELLEKIIANAQQFRNHVAAYCNPVLSTRNEAETQRFYLRKIEGAEILLANETNFFRQELHKWSPVAPEAPPIIEVSKSTRKPRPTKLDKLLLEHGVTDVEDLPEAVKSKGLNLKRKRQNAAMAAQAAQQAAAGSSTVGQATSPGVHSYASFYQRGTSSQPQTPGLSVASSSHAHPSRGPESSSSHGHPHARADSSGPALQPEPVEIDSSNSNIRPGPFLDSNVGPQLEEEEEDDLADDDQFAYQGWMTTAIRNDIVAARFGKDAEAYARLLATREGRAIVRAAKDRDPDAFDMSISEPTAGGPSENEDGVDDGDVDQMFADMVNQDDEDEKGKGVAGKGPSNARDDEKITAESLENERNGIDALLDGE